MSKQFYFMQFSLAWIHSLVLFDSQMGFYQVLPLLAKMDLGAITMKEYSAFPKTPAWLELLYQIVLYRIQDTHWRGGWGSYPRCRDAVVYYTAPADRAKKVEENRQYLQKRKGKERNFEKIDTTYKIDKWMNKLI